MDNKNTHMGMNSAITSAAVGLLAGTAAYMMSGNDRGMQLQAKKVKRSAGKAMRNAGIILDGVSQLMK